MAVPERRILISPVRDDAETIDVTEAVIAAIAHELWKLHGGNATLNWLEAERFVQAKLLRDDEPTASLPFKTTSDAVNFGRRRAA